MKTAECVQLYTLEEAEKIISYRRRKTIRKKRQALKQKLAIKSLCLACLVLGIAATIICKADNGGAVAVALIGLLGLVVPFNAKITW